MILEYRSSRVSNSQKLPFIYRSNNQRVMSAFTQFTSIQPLPKANKRITTAPLVYRVGSEDSDEIITVPTGFEFDGASVPMIFWRLIQRVEPQTISAACVHDYLYTEGRRYTLAKTDYIFYEALCCTTSKRKALIMRLWVRLWGRLYWYKII